MKIYTKTGDQGQTSLFGGTRVPKHNIRIEAYGTVDELNAHLGMLRSLEIGECHQKRITEIQRELFQLGAELAVAPEKAILRNGKERLQSTKIKAENIRNLESMIDNMTESLAPLRNFLLPGGHPTIAQCHIARTVCRRAERKAAALYEEHPFNVNILRYLNRLSDYLFTLSRKIALELDSKEMPVKISRIK